MCYRTQVKTQTYSIACKIIYKKKRSLNNYSLNSLYLAIISTEITLALRKAVSAE